MEAAGSTVGGKHHAPDYIDRTIETVRVHRNADNCWPSWANIFADEIEAYRSDVERARAELEECIDLCSTNNSLWAQTLLAGLQRAKVNLETA